MKVRSEEVRIRENDEAKELGTSLGVSAMVDLNKVFADEILKEECMKWNDGE